MLTINNGDATSFSLPQAMSDLSGMVPMGQIPTLNQNTSGTSAGLSGTPTISVKRVNAHGGTVPTSSSLVASSGWGTSPVITIVGGTDQGLSFTIQAKATVGANPTITYTFKDGTWTTVPVVVACRTDINAATGAPTASVNNDWAVTSVTATAVVFTFNGTPVANTTYGCAFITMGT
jgi:hypothetical protein